MAKHALKRVPRPKAKPKKNAAMVFGRNPRLVTKFPTPKKKPKRNAR